MFMFRKSKGLTGAVKTGAGLLLAFAIMILMVLYVVPAFAIMTTTELTLTPNPPATSTSWMHRGDSVNASVQWNETIISAVASYQVHERESSSRWINQTISTFTGNWTNATISLNDSQWYAGVRSVKIYATGASGNNVTSERNLTIWGWSKIAETNHASSTLNQSQSEMIDCKVVDNYTNTPLVGYPVSFYQNSSFLGNNTTQATGHAYFNLSIERAGTFNISCNITEAPSLYYNASAINMGSYTLTVNDSTGPEYYGVTADGGTVGIGINKTLSSAWNDRDSELGYAVLWTNESGVWGPQIGKYGSPMSLTGSVDESTFVWNNSLVTPQNTVIQWAIHANDSIGNLNMTPNRTFTVIDLTVPTWSNQYQNATVIHAGEVLNLSAVWNDNALLSRAWLATNETGSWVNYTSGTRDISGSGTGPVTVNFTWQNSTAKAAIIGWRIYANDSAGNTNATGISSISSYGWSNLTNASSLLSSYNRSSIVPITCLVRDANTSAGIGGYPVTFWNNGVLNTNYTNATGHATWYWNTTADSVGSHNITCNITSNSSLIYDSTSASSWNSTTGIVGYLRPSTVSSPSFIYRNDSYTPFSTTFLVTILDELGSPVENANVSFWNNSISASLIGSCLTESSGLCPVSWNANDTLQPGNYTISYNVTRSSYNIATNSTFKEVHGKLSMNVTSIQSGSVFYKTTNMTLNSLTRDENNAVATPGSVNWTLIENNSAMMGKACLAPGCENATWYISGDMALGAYTLNATATKTFYDSSSQTREVEIWGWSALNSSSIPTSSLAGSVTNLRCKVTDNVTGSAINGYTVHFYNSTQWLNSVSTNSSGWATLGWTWGFAGQQNITCNVTNDNGKFYSASSVNSDTKSIMVYGSLSMQGASEAPQKIYVDMDNTTMLRLNITAYAESVNLTSITVYLNGTATSGNITSVQLWNDTNGNPGSMIASSSGAFPLTITPAGGLNITGSRIYHLAVNASDGALERETVGIYVPNGNVTAVGLTSGLSIVPAGTPFVSGLSEFAQRPLIGTPHLTSPTNDAYTQNSTINFTWTQVSGAANYTIRIGNTSSTSTYQYINVTNQTNYTWTSEEGAWWWWVRATDQFGREDPSFEQRKLIVDRTEPYVEVVTPINNSIVQPSTTLRYTPSDGFSTAMSCTYILDNVPNASSTKNINNNTYWLEPLGGLANGQHNVSVNCTDLAGNSNVSETVFFTVDSELPVTIIGTSSINTSADPGGYWLWSFNITLRNTTSGPFVRMKLANWTDGAGHQIGVDGNARMLYCNSTMSYCNTSAELNTYNIKNDYDESQNVAEMLDLNLGEDGVQTIVWLNMSIPIGTFPTDSYSTTYRFGLY